MATDIGVVATGRPTAAVPFVDTGSYPARGDNPVGPWIDGVGLARVCQPVDQSYCSQRHALRTRAERTSQSLRSASPRTNACRKRVASSSDGYEVGAPGARSSNRSPRSRRKISLLCTSSTVPCAELVVRLIWPAKSLGRKRGASLSFGRASEATGRLLGAVRGSTWSRECILDR